MKKAMLLFVAMTYYASVAQNILLQENFTNYAGTTGTVPLGWKFSHQGNYTSNLSSGLSGPNSYKFGAGNATIISPSFKPGIDSLSFWIKGNGTDANSRLHIYESADSLNWILSDSIMPLPTSGIVKKRKLLSSTSWLKFVYIKSAGNLAFDDIIVTSYVPPVADFSMPAYTCINIPLLLQGDAGGNIKSWYWDFGNGQTASGQSPFVTYTQHGSYRIRLMVKDVFGLSDTIEKTIEVRRKPTIGFSYTNSMINQPTCFTAHCDTSGSRATAQQFYWSFHDPQAPQAGSVLENPCYTYTAPGNYTVCLNVLFSNNGCGTTDVWDSLALPVSIYSWQGVQAGFTCNPVCAGTCMSFHDKSITTNTGIITHNWDFGDGYIDSSANPCHLYALAGNYSVTLKAIDNTGATDTIIQNVTVYPTPPQPTIQVNNVCLGQPLYLSVQDTSTEYSCHWDFGDNNVATSPQACHTYAQAGIYTLSCTLTTSNSCSTTASNTLTVYTPPQASFIYNNCGNMGICFNGNTTHPVILWQWDFGDGSLSTIPNPQHLYSTNGVYPVCLMVKDAQGCNDTVCDNIIINTTGLDKAISTSLNLQDMNEGWLINNLPEGITSRIELINTEGSCLFTQNVRNPQFLLYKLGLPEGLYFVRITDKKSCTTLKVIMPSGNTY